jgi:hypothetical protein
VTHPTPAYDADRCDPPVIVAANACTTRALTFGEIKVPAGQVHAAFLAALKSYGQVLKTEEILEQLKG